jgi:hypothetical protein
MNQMSLDDLNTSVFDKRVWDTFLPIQVIANDQLLRSPMVNILDSCLLDSGGVYAVTNFTGRTTSRSEKPVPKVDINIEGITQIQDAYVAVSRYKAWGQEEVARDVVGADLLEETNKVSVQYWADDWQLTILDMLHGIFSGTLQSTHSVDASAYTMSWGAVEEAVSRLGDRARANAVIVMHNKQLSNLKQNCVIKYKEAGELGYDVWVKGLLPTVNGLPIITMDTIPTSVVDNVTRYHAFVGAKDSIEFRIINFNNKYYWDKIGAGTEYLIQTCRIMMRVPGVKFMLNNASDMGNPSYSDFRNPLCWQRVAQANKDIPLVELITTADVTIID